MRLFRSEEHVQAWSRRTRIPLGATFSIDSLWRLAQRWFHDRLSPTWRRRPPAETRAVFAESGLTGDFWRLEG
jgi:hypothetical protein